MDSPGGNSTGADKAIAAAMSVGDEAERYRLLAKVFEDLSQQAAARATRGGDDASRAAAKRAQALAEEKAALDDELRSVRADLAHRSSQYEAEQVRCGEQQSTIEELRARLTALQRDRDEVEAQLVAKNSALHRSQTECEELTLKLQRAELAGGDTSAVERLETSRAELLRELESTRHSMEQMRLDKDAEIERLKGEVHRMVGSSGRGADAQLAELWQRLRKGTPALVTEAEPPNVQAAERLFDAFLELARFVDEFDKGMRVFLDRYTKHHSSVKVPWEVYARREDVLETVRQTVDVKSGRPVGLLKMRLRVLYSWCYAAMLGTDSAVESIASELRSQLYGPLGIESNPNCTLKEYMREDGPEKFLERVREVRSLKLAEAFGKGG